MASTVRQQTNLVRREGVYQFRIAVPADLRGHFNGNREVRRSLRTKNKAEAIKRGLPSSWREMNVSALAARLTCTR